MNKKILSLLALSYFLCAGTVKIKQVGQPDVYVPTMDSTNSSNLTLTGQMSVKNGITAPGNLTLNAATGSVVTLSKQLTANSGITTTSGNLVLDAATGSVITLNKQLTANSGITTTSGDLTIAAVSGSNVVINSTFKTTGSLVYNVRTVSTTGSLTSTDFVVIATASITLTLPSQTSGRFLEIKRNTIAGFVTITPATGMIDGGSNYVLTANYQSVSLVSDGTNWWVL